MQKHLSKINCGFKSLFIVFVLAFVREGFAACELTIDGVVPDQITMKVDLTKDCLPPGLHVAFEGLGTTVSQRNRNLVLVCDYNSFTKGPYRIRMQMFGETTNIRFGDAETEVRAGFDIKDVHLGFAAADGTGAHLLCY